MDMQRSNSLKLEISRLAGDIEQEIRSGRLLPGNRLPGEAELCRDYRASRPAVREALQSLKARGLVVSRRGSGSYVSQDTGAGSLRESMELYAALRQEGTAFRELMELRQMIECSCVEVLAKPDFLSTRKKLWDCLRSMELCAGNLEAFGRADIAFHMVLVDGAGNALFSTIMGGLMPGLGVRFALETYVESWLVKTILAEHRAICRSLDAGSGLQARRELQRHLKASRNRFEFLLKTGRLRK
jgi:DNA-binding FadR family transcriptional regulator